MDSIPSIALSVTWQNYQLYGCKKPNRCLGIPPLGLSEDPELQPLLFGLYFSLYLVLVCGNLLIILAFTFNFHLHTPMGFFLSHLSFMIFVSTPPWFPSADEHPDSEQSHHLTYADCITQIYFFSVFVCLDNLLLVMMAYDKFMAICHPCTKQS